MPYFYNNPQIAEKLNSLPQSIKSEIIKNGKEINSAAELNELVRRVQSSQTGRIF